MKVPKKTVLQCANCGKDWWLTQEETTDHRRRSKHFFCSSECSAEFRREIGDDLVARAVELRENGETWTALSKCLGFTAQAIQVRIWRRLHETGLLRDSIVRAIWVTEPTRGKKPSWGWIESKTGLSVEEAQCR